MSPELIISRLDFDPDRDGQFVVTSYFFRLPDTPSHEVSRRYFLRCSDEVSFVSERFEDFQPDTPVKEAMLVRFPSLRQEKGSRVGASMSAADLVVLEMLVTSRSTEDVIGG